MKKNIDITNKGFSLIEMAMVLLILGILLSGLLVSIGQSTNNARRTSASNQLKEIQEALYGFAQTNGRLPCPANHLTSGIETYLNLDGECTVYHGFIPNVTLGLSGSINSSDRLLLDPWNNPYRYSVTSYVSLDNMGNPNGRAFTSVSGLANMFEDSTQLISTNMLTVCDNPTDCANTALVDTAPAVIFSMGANWAEHSALASAAEQENAGDFSTFLGTYPITNTTNFVSTGYSEENFDDMVIWISPHILYSRLIKAEQLP